MVEAETHVRNAPTRPPVVILVLDTLRSDMTDRDDLLTSLPTLRKLFEESYVFTRGYAPSHWTLPSHASLFKGLTPAEHMARPPNMKLREDVPTIAEIFRRQGYVTACLTCNPFLSDGFGMTRGFDVVWVPPVHPVSNVLKFVNDFFSRRASNGSKLLRSGRDLIQLISSVVKSSPRMDNGARAAVRCAVRVIRKDAQTPFLLANLMEAHQPYHGRGKSSGWRQRIHHAAILNHWDALRISVMSGRVAMTQEMRCTIRDIYWENVRYMDSQIRFFLQHLPKSFLDNGFLFVVSDHGQMLGEKGQIAHMSGLAEELIRVPLLIRPPGGANGLRVNSLADITWLFFLLKSIASGMPEAFTS